MPEDHARVVVITGAASGIGRATALRLAGPGTALVLTTRANDKGLDATADEARRQGADVTTLMADLSEPSTAQALVDRARTTFGRIDQLVSNAGRADKRPFGTFGAGDLDAQVALHAAPFAALVTAALDDLRASAWGRVVAVSSFVAHQVGTNDVVFPTTAAAKGALEALARTLARQLAADGTTVNVVVPGYTRKESAHAALDAAGWAAAAQATPAGRIAEPDEVAAAIAFFLSEDARHITGQRLHVDGGLSLG